MPEGRLYIGTRRYSSWSWRGWLAVRLAGLDVEDVAVPLTGTGASPAVKAVSPSGFVPYLEHRGVKVWDSLAIAEYCAEQRPGLWPADPAARAWARAMAAEMHAGFTALRQAMPMSLFRHRPGFGHTEAALADVARIEGLWRETRARFAGAGPYLFGAELTLADAFYVPVVARFLSYEPPLSREARDYVAAIRAHPLVEAWYEAARTEPPEWRLAKYEDVESGAG